MSKSILRKVSVTAPLLGLAFMVSGCVVSPIGVTTYPSYNGYATPEQMVVVEPAPVYAYPPVYRPYYGRPQYFHHWIR